MPPPTRSADECLPIAETPPSALERTAQVSASYGALWSLRAAVQAVPVVGGPIDTLLAGAGANYQQRRLERFYDVLKARLEEVSRFRTLPLVEPDEPLFDFVRLVHESVVRSGSEEKRVRFASLFTQQITERRPWDEAQEAVTLLNELSDLQVGILHIARSVTNVYGDGTRSEFLLMEPNESVLKNSNFDLPNLRTFYPAMPIGSLKTACARLVALGLIEDSGVLRIETPTLLFLRFTSFADWFVRWIQSA